MYQWLPRLQQPKLSEEEIEAMVDDTEARERHLSAFVRIGKEASSASRHADAAEAFAKAHALRPNCSPSCGDKRQPTAAEPNGNLR